MALSSDHLNSTDVGFICQYFIAVLAPLTLSLDINSNTQLLKVMLNTNTLPTPISI